MIIMDAANIPDDLLEYFEPIAQQATTVWPYQADNFPGAHYAVMPSNVALPCVLAGSRPGDVVLDPFAGTGTTGKVARSHGRRFIGIDIDERNIELMSSSAL
jgi:DNA modification methylase